MKKIVAVFIWWETTNNDRSFNHVDFSLRLAILFELDPSCIQHNHNENNT